MTDTIPRQAAIDAVRSVPPGTTCRGDAIIDAINAIPAVTVTDDMVERAAKAWCERDDSYSSFGYTAYLRDARELLVAALGE